MSRRSKCITCGSPRLSAYIEYPGPCSEGQTRLVIECSKCKMAVSEPYWESIEEYFGMNNDDREDWGKLYEG